MTRTFKAASRAVITALLREAFGAINARTKAPTAAARKGAGSEGTVAKRIVKDQPSDDKLNQQNDYDRRDIYTAQVW